MVTYDEWILHVFDHPLPPEADDAVKQAHYEIIRLSTEKLQAGEVTFADIQDDIKPQPWYTWYFQWDAEYLEIEPLATVEYITRAFNSIDTIANSYSDGQMNQGIEYVINNACSNTIFALMETSMPLEKRLKAVESFYTVYEKLFAVKCEPLLGHLSEKGNPLNNICYMWWDIIPFYGKADDARQDLDQTMLNVMKRSLALKHEACQEGALHGLGHWHSAYPMEIEAIIDDFLAKNAVIRKELKDYALQAHRGNVL